MSVTATKSTKPELTGTQIRSLKALAKAKGPLTRAKLSKAAFNGNSVNFAPILGPLVTSKLVSSKELDIDGVKEEVFTVTPAGRKVANSAPTVTGRDRSNGQHETLPKVGGTFSKTYKGKEIKVTVVADGFRVGGKVYPSLTAAAKAVRGSDQEVNGWAFFGLVKAKAE